MARSDVVESTDPLLIKHMEGTLGCLEGATNYRDWLLDSTRPHLGPRVLEVGAGVGTMSSCLTGCDRVVALELVPEYVEMLRGRLAGRPGFEVLEGDATDDTLMMPLRGAFDAAFSFNVLEHIKDDQAAFRNIRESLVPGGRFVCFVPAFPVLYGPMDTSLGHHRRYRRRELRDKAEAAGFNVLHLYYMNSLGFFAWFLNGRVARSNTPAGGQTTVLAYDRFVIPALRWLEGIKHPPFGQSLMLVAQR